MAAVPTPIQASGVTGTEPVALQTAVNTAILMTIALLGIFDVLSNEAVGALSIVAAAWIVVAGIVVRSLVWSRASVRAALTGDEPPTGT